MLIKYNFNFLIKQMIKVNIKSQTRQTFMDEGSSCLDSTYTNFFTATRGVFNFLYKEIIDPIIFGIHVLRLSNTLCRFFFSYH
jgi:hypothetical protein